LDLPDFGTEAALPIVFATLDETLQALPPSIQTIGHALVEPSSPRWLNALARSKVKRFVPIGIMHHFGPVWDGHAFFRQLFEEVEVIT
jgi:hypothetical protein